jgi:hypothetical protein
LSILSHSDPRIAYVGRTIPQGTLLPAFRERNLRVRYHTPACIEFAYGRLRPTTRSVFDSGEAFVTMGFGGFGNEFASFIRGLFLCYIFGYEKLVISQLSLIITITTGFNTTDGIQISLQALESLPPTYVNVNSFEVDGAPECPLDDIAIAATIKDQLVAGLPKVDVNSSALYICARGGEVMVKGTPFYFYGQPPCQYYLDAMRMDGAPMTVVMSNHNEPNPCVEPLVAQGAVYGSLQGPREDLARFVHSRRMVVSRTSFTMAIMLLSKPKDVLYAFVTRYSTCIWVNHSRLHDDYDRFGPHHKCRATDEYDEKVLREWHATDEQIAIMRTTKKGCVWEYG